MSRIPEGSVPDASPTAPAQSAESASRPQHAPSERLSFLSRIQSLNTAEKYWSWKAGMRVSICVLNIIGIGCTAWLISVAPSLDNLYYYSWAASPGWQGGLVAILCVSLIWCLLSILIPLFLKPVRPLHPGIAVGIDLILWIGFVLLGLLTVVVVYDVATFGDDGTIADPSYGYGSSNYSGQYSYVVSDNTWVYNVTYIRGQDDSPYYNYTAGEWEYPDPNLNASSVVRDCTPLFSTCEQQDQWVNGVWREKPQRLATSVLADAVQWLNVLLHFVLFIWACVDTHRYNARSSTTKEQIVADRIIADLESKGIISVMNGVVQPARTGQPQVTAVPTPHAM